MEIPKISNKNLNGLIKKIRPVVRFAEVNTSRERKMEIRTDGDLYFIEDVKPRSQTFTWEPKAKKIAESINPNHYMLIQTIHNYGVPGLFKPSIAEVLAQIPEDELERCVAFETTYLNLTEDSEHHLGQTKLYEQK